MAATLRRRSATTAVSSVQRDIDSWQRWMVYAVVVSDGDFAYKAEIWHFIKASTVDLHLILIIHHRQYPATARRLTSLNHLPNT